jgi:hypothetical protein
MRSLDCRVLYRQSSWLHGCPQLSQASGQILQACAKQVRVWRLWHARLVAQLACPAAHASPHHTCYISGAHSQYCTVVGSHPQPLLSDDQSDSDDSEMSAESAGGTIDWDIPMKLPRSVLLAARQARAAQDAATHSVSSSLKLPPPSKADMRALQALCMAAAVVVPRCPGPSIMVRCVPNPAADIRDSSRSHCGGGRPGTAAGICCQ